MSSLRVPRYTSYPTALQFETGFDSAEFKTWLSELGDDQRISLYFHIPFCHKLCWFCGCYTKVVNHYSPIKNYLGLLTKEAGLVSSLVADKKVQHIHFGGGSPSVVQDVDFQEFMNFVRGNFDVDASAEIAMEIDPRTVGPEKIASYVKSGVNRVSIGVQDFDRQVQSAIHREQTFNLVRSVIETFRKFNVRGVNLDLIYGLPKQRFETFERTVDLTIELAPERISLFGYAHLPNSKKNQRLIREDLLPTSLERLELNQLARDKLEAAGYIAIGLDHFALKNDELAEAYRKRTLRRNFQGYTTDHTEGLIGMGASSISSLPAGYAQNFTNYYDYKKHVDEGQLPLDKGVRFKGEDKKRRKIIMSLMCYLQANVPDSQFMSEINQLAPFIDRGEVTYDGEILKVSDDARNQIRVIASAFDEYFNVEEQRYSTAI